MPDSITIGRRNITCRQENSSIGYSFVGTHFEGWMLGMVCNHLLDKMNW